MKLASADQTGVLYDADPSPACVDLGRAYTGPVAPFDRSPAPFVHSFAPGVGGFFGPPAR